MKRLLAQLSSALLLLTALPGLASATYIEIGFPTWQSNPVQTVGDQRFTLTGSSAIPASARVRLGEPLPGLVWIQLDGGTTPLTNFTLQFQLKHLQPDGHYTSVDLDSITNAPRRALVTPSQVKAHIFDPTPLPLDVLTSTWGAPSLSYFPANRQAELWFDVQGTVGHNGLISDAKLELQTVMSPEPSSALLMLPAVGVCLWLRRRQARRRLVPATVQST
ncbi:MAG: hypothetical protein ACK5F7_15355 [Planctomycetaceae bacterium]